MLVSLLDTLQDEGQGRQDVRGCGYHAGDRNKVTCSDLNIEGNFQEATLHQVHIHTHIPFPLFEEDE